MLKLLVPFAVGASVVAVPHAGAAVTELSVPTGLSNGYGSGCSYTITARVDSAEPVVFTDAAGATFTPTDRITPVGGVATVNWIPSAPGVHVVTAAQGLSVQVATKVVGVGVATGSTTCRVF